MWPTGARRVFIHMYMRQKFTADVTKYGMDPVNIGYVIILLDCSAVKNKK